MVTEENTNGNEITPNENEGLDVTGENTVVVQEVEAVYDPDEKILQDMYDSGKTQITTNDLIVAGFNTSRITGSYTFNIGRFKLSRLLLLSPYTLEKTQ
jgi:hypothetical protein